MNTETFTAEFDTNGKIINVEPIVPSQPNDEIWYTSTNGNIVNKAEYAGSDISVFGANIVSNTYSGGKGIIKFDGNVTSIGDMAFIQRDKLNSITIPNSVTSIGGYTFYGCSGLTFATIGNSVTEIGMESFEDCTSLTGITIPNSVDCINFFAFRGCSSLTGVTIPNSVTMIGGEAFRNCTSLIEVICNPTTPPMTEAYAFRNNASGRKIKVPAGSVNAYKTATNWSEYANDIISL